MCSLAGGSNVAQSGHLRSVCKFPLTTRAVIYGERDERLGLSPLQTVASTQKEHSYPRYSLSLALKGVGPEQFEVFREGL